MAEYVDLKRITTVIDEVIEELREWGGPAEELRGRLEEIRAEVEAICPTSDDPEPELRYQFSRMSSESAT